MRDLEFDIKARDKTASGFDSARANARGFNRDLDLTARGFNIAAAAGKAFAAAFTLTAVSEFGRVVRQTITDAADLVDLADKVGVSTENIQRMVYGFGQAGVAASDIDQVLTQWSKRIGEAYTNGGRLAEILKANNISLTDSEGRLRSSVDLMRDYADLIANAGSDQERMTLATEAFGKAGDAMVLALRDGADGMDRLMASADEAGGVLEDELLQRAARIDDEFNLLWRNFETEAKRAILNAVGWLDDLRGRFAEYEKSRNAALLGAQAGALAGTKIEGPTSRLPSPITERIDDAFNASAQAQNEAMARMLRDRFAPRTVIPGGDGSDQATRTASAAAAREQESAYQRVIEQLDEERAMIGLNETDQRILIEQRRAGVSATSEQGQAIAALVRQIDAETERLKLLEKQQKAVEDAANALAGSGLDAVLSWAQGAESAEEAARSLANEILRMVAYAALLGEGPLAGILGTGSGAGSGGLIGMLFSGISGARAEGGPVDPFKTYLVGEKGPELLRMGNRAGQVVSNSDAFGSTSDSSAQPSAPANIFHVSIVTPDPPSFAKSKGQIETMLARAVMRGNRGL